MNELARRLRLVIGEGGRGPEGSAPPGARDLQLLDRIFSTSLETLALVDDNRRYLRINEPGTGLLGASRAEILTRAIDDFTPREHRLRLQYLWNQLRVRGELEGDYEVLRGDGTRGPIAFRARWDLTPGAHLIAALPLPQPSAEPPASGRVASLSRREREIFELVAAGYSSKDIAAQLILSLPTVNTHLRNGYRKLGVHGRAAAVAVLLRDQPGQ